MLYNQNIVCLSNMHWDGHMTCKQQIMSRLAKQNRVLYVNRALTFLSPFSGNEEISPWRQIYEMLFKPHEVRKNLFVATPPLVFPLRYSRFSGTLNYIIFLTWLKRTMIKLEMINPIIWTYLPESAKIVRNLPKTVSVYHCVDEHSEWGNWWNPSSMVQFREKTLITEVDLVIATSRRLQKEKAEFNSNCHFVPNAANYELFSRALGPETKIPSDLLHIPKPIIGYVGILGPDHIDIDWIEFASKRTSYNFVFVGRKYTRSFDLSRLASHKNVFFLGFKEPIELPGYLRGMDVCIIPYVKCKRIEAVFPLKLFEYLSAGKPVVARRTGELEPYSDLLYLVDTPEEFVSAIELSLCEDNPERIVQRVSFAEKNTWDARVEDISSIIETNLN